MEIKTKYSIGDKIYTIDDNFRAVEKTIKRISIFVWHPDETKILYDFEEGGCEEYEYRCFSSLSDLLKQIKGDMEL